MATRPALGDTEADYDALVAGAANQTTSTVGSPGSVAIHGRSRGWGLSSFPAAHACRALLASSRKWGQSRPTQRYSTAPALPSTLMQPLNSPAGTVTDSFNATML